MNWSAKCMFAASIIAIFHLVGWIGMDRSSYGAFFESISWVNILLSFILLLWCHEPVASRAALIAYVAAVALLGMAAEVVGVSTGLIFGHYHYTPVLGAAVLGVPIIIGINWAMLTYAAAVTSSLIPMPVWARVVAGAVMMVLCDMLLEGFAVRHHFWVWDGMNEPPLTNFIGWLVVSLVSNIIFMWLIPDTRNKLVPFYLFVFLVFLLADKLI